MSTGAMPASLRVVQVVMFCAAAIAISGGVSQMSLGQPDAAVRVDNLHRFLAGVYLGAGIIVAWTAFTIRRHDMLIYLIALMVLLGGIGRFVSMAKLGVPEPFWLWMGYALTEVIIPVIIVVAYRASGRRA